MYADGRPDELVRGVDIVGTPLAALTRIMTTGDQQHVFNGVCGAESGSVPVSAVAPAMLFSEMEVQKRGHLPHWEQSGATYFVTFRLTDSLPADVLAQGGAHARRAGAGARGSAAHRGASEGGAGARDRR